MKYYSNILNMQTLTFASKYIYRPTTPMYLRDGPRLHAYTVFQQAS